MRVFFLFILRNSLICTHFRYFTTSFCRGLIIPKKIPMGGAIIQILPIFDRFFSVWVRESLCFDQYID